MSSAQSMAETGRFSERRALVVGGVPLLLLSFQTLGIIYSDIGTSPLYVLNGIWPADQPPPSEEDVIGGISAIIWALTLLPLLKYVFIGLRFGTEEGEGGTFALYHALFPPPKVDHDDERTLTGDFTTSSGGGVTLKKSSTGVAQGSRLRMWKWPLLIWALFGTSLTMADGIFTPAVSVTSAVAGLALVQPSLNYSIIPISIAFLVVLFLAQRFGTAKLAFTFAPVTCAWLLLLAATGIYNIVSFPGIFRAFDPSRAVMLFVRTGKYDILSGVLLAVTGCEALFANLGQFNMLSIQLSFATFTYPALVLAYLGQGARLVQDGEAVIANIFYATIPGPTGGGLYWLMYVFAILATLVASQTMITAVFSLIQQIINLKSLPPLQMSYTSETVQGQIYVPAANWILFIATIAVVAGFQSPVALTNAYGFSVATVMIVTSTLIAISIPLVKRQHWILGLAFFVFFGFIDGLFWGAALTKVPQGAWVPLMLGGVLMILMTFWTWAKGLEDAFDGANRRNLRQIIVSGNEQTQPLLDQTPATEKAENESEKVEAGAPSGPYLPQAIPAATEEDEATALYLVSEVDDSKTKLARLPTCAVFHKFAAGKGVPHSFVGFLRQWPALPRVIIFLSVRIVPIAHVEKDDRYFVTKVRSVPGFYGVTYCLGFRDDFKVDVNDVIERIVSLEIRADPRESRATVNEIRNAGLRSTHIIPHYHVVSDVQRVRFGFLTPVVRWTRAFLIEGIYRRLVTMFPETANWLESADEIIRVGVTAQI